MIKPILTTLTAVTVSFLTGCVNVPEENAYMDGKHAFVVNYATQSSIDPRVASLTHIDGTKLPFSYGEDNPVAKGVKCKIRGEYTFAWAIPAGEHQLTFYCGEGAGPLGGTTREGSNTLKVVLSPGMKYQPKPAVQRDGLMSVFIIDPITEKVLIDPQRMQTRETLSIPVPISSTNITTVPVHSTTNSPGKKEE